MTKKNPAAVALGSIKSAAKAIASRANGQKGGRPRKTAKKLAMLLLAVFASACANPLAPETPHVTAPAVSAPAVVTPPVWALSGQSNAVNVKPFLEASATIVGVAVNGQPIVRWASDGDLWLQLRDTLTPDVRAFIWWQGESDAVLQTPTYASDLRDLLTRVQARSPQATLLIVGLADMPEPTYVKGYTAIREAQRTVAAQVGARYVSAEGEPIDPAVVFHLQASGYDDMARRITAALR